MTLDEDQMDVTESETTVDLVMDTKRFSELVSQLLIFNEVLRLTFTEEEIHFIASGTEGKMRCPISLEDVQEYAIGEGYELAQSYSLKYLSMMCYFSRLAGEVIMGFSESRPMSLKYDLGDSSYVCFYLAPRIDE